MKMNITAESAKVQTNMAKKRKEYWNEKSRQLRNVEKLINLKSKRGHNQIVFHSLCDEVCDALRENGFKIEEHDIWCSSWIVVRW